MIANVLVLSARADEGGGPRQLRDVLEWSRARGETRVRWFLACPSRGVHSGPMRALADEWIELPHRRFSLGCFEALRALVRRAPIHVVHSFGRGAGVYARLLARLGAPVVHTPQGIRPSGLKAMPAIALERLLRRRTALFFFGSHDEARAACDVLGEVPFELWPPMVHAPRHAPLRDRVGERIEAGEPLRLVTLARLDRHKNVGALLEGFAAFAGKPLRVELRIYGEGPERAWLERRAGALGLRDVRFEGPASDPWAALDAADVFVSASRSESFGMAVAQAMSLGLPCVLSDVAGHRDLGARGGRAWMVSLESPAEIAASIESIVAAPADRARRVEDAATHVRSSFTPDAIGERLFACYARLTHAVP